MNTHKNAPLTPKGREAMVRAVVDGGLCKAAARASSTPRRRQCQMGRTLPRGRCRWVARPLLTDLIHCQAKHRLPHVPLVEALRRQRHTGKQIAAEVGVSPATVSRILRRLGLNRLRLWNQPSRCAAMNASIPARSSTSTSKSSAGSIISAIASPATAAVRATAARGRGSAGSTSTSASTMLSRDRLLPRSCLMRRSGSAVAFLKAALAYYASLGLKVERVMTDNGSCYKSFAFRRRLPAASASSTSAPNLIRPRPTARPSASSRPLLREWAYAQAYPTLNRRAERTAAWLHRYNWHRPHAGIQIKHPSADSV